MGFYQDIKHQYGLASVVLLKSWANLNNKRASMHNRKLFLLKCRQLGLLPNHIIHGTNSIHSTLHIIQGRTGKRITNFNIRLGKSILNLEIRATFVELNKIQENIKTIIYKLNSLIPNYIINEYDRRLQVTYEKLFKSIKATHLNKIAKLERDQLEDIKTQDKWFRNLTTITFPEDIKQILSLGRKFSLCPTIKELNIPSLLADLETAIARFDTQQKDLFRNRFTNIITKFIQHQGTNKQHFNEVFNKTKRFLQEHPEAYVTGSDKGNVTVIMHKEDYLSKSLDLLQDPKYYKKLNSNPTSTIQTRANKLIKSLKDNKHIDNETAKAMTTYNSVAPRLYTLPKIHKPTLAMRPIVSSINCPNSSLATYVTSILTNAYDIDNEFYVKDSFTFSTYINNFQLPDNYVLVSFDVVSLFTNLPLEAVLESIKNNWDSISPHCSLNYETMENLLTFIFDSNYCVFNGEYYKQIFGTPMGSTISPILVNYVLDDLIRDCLQYLPYYIPFVKRYVDDLILAVPQCRIHETLEMFNTYNQHIQFTVEEESEQSIPFLDMKVKRSDNNVLSTVWYRKPMASNRFISFRSYHPMKMKINLILGLKRRAVLLTHPKDRQASLKLLQTMLLENSYPLKIINKFLYSTIYQLPENIIQRPSQPPPLNTQPTPPIQNGNLQDHSNNPPVFYCTLPYVEVLTSQLIKLFDSTDVKFAKKQVKTVSQLYTKTKTPLSIHENWNVIYQIPCNNCNEVYIGQTSRNLSGRITSHKSDCRRLVPSCALVEHVIDKEHEMKFSDPKVLAKSNNYYKRLFLEMVHIHGANHCMNKKTDTQNLSTIYSFLLKLHKETFT